MATFIKAGFWETLCAKCTGYKGWLNLDKFVESKIPAPAYKVYTALLTQSGGDDPQYQQLGSLVVGRTYEIADNGVIDWDFTNVGAPNNEIGTLFVATGTTPANWGQNGNLNFNTGAPVVTVLENTIGNIVWSYDIAGVYYGTLVDAFTENKTWLSGPFGSDQGIYGVPALNEDLTNNGRFVIVTREDSDKVRVTTLLQPEDIDNDVLDNFPIEIRVYN